MACAAPAVAALARPSLAEEVTKPKTYPVKVVDNCNLLLDHYEAPGNSRRHLVMWIHGGALIMGDRRGIDRALLARLLKSGYSVASISYRLAPETKLPAILEDVQDAYRLLQRQGTGTSGSGNAKVAVMGGSAGGYLTLTAGYRLQPRPAALVSLWGYGDIAGPWYSRPDPFYCRLPLVSPEKAHQSVGPDSSGNNRQRFYLYCRQQGRWPIEVTGHDPDKEPDFFKAWCPVRNVSADYPPTLLVHGTKDTDVPYQQSVTMARELGSKSVAHELITIQTAATAPLASIARSQRRRMTVSSRS
jgi:acetyl esterase/lipase